MRFVPKKNEVNSPRRRRKGAIGHGPYMPPVLARLPEIVPDAEVDEDDANYEESVFIDGKQGRKFRIDEAQPSAAQPDSEKTPTVADEPIEAPISTTEVSTAIDSLVVSNQVVSSAATATQAPTLPPLPAADFAQTAAKILAQLEGAEAAASDSVPVASAQAYETNTTQYVTEHPVAEHTVAEHPVTEHPVAEHPATEQPVFEHPVTEADSLTTTKRNFRIDPGIPSPIAQGIPAEETERERKRRAARQQTAPELDVLDSPWHDWIVKLGGTFIAGLLLVAAFQAIQPDSRSQRIGADPQMDAEFLNDPSVNPQPLVSMPAQEPGVLGAPQDAPVFIDPNTIEDAGDPESQVVETKDGESGYTPVEIATVSPDVTADATVESTPESKMPTLDELAGDLMPAPAISVPNDDILPMPSDDGNLVPEVAAVIDNNLVTSNNTTSDRPAIVENSLIGPKVQDSLFGPPTTAITTTTEEKSSQSDTRIALKDAAAGNQPTGPITGSNPNPQTGYAPISRVRPETSQPPMQQPIAPPQQSIAPPQQSYAVPPGTSVPPQPRMTMVPAPTQRRPQFNMLPQTGGMPQYVQPGVVPAEPRSPMSVQLNGTIQQYSR